MLESNECNEYRHKYISQYRNFLVCGIFIKTQSSLINLYTIAIMCKGGLGTPLQTINKNNPVAIDLTLF